MVGIALAILILLGIWWWQRRRSPRRLSGISLPQQGSQKPSGDTVPRRLMGELHRLTRDRRVSERLISQISLAHPQKSRRWCVEKAIYDIQRDRRS